MLRVPCNCGSVLEVPSELAGSSIQCPDCRLLVDIPALHELANFAPDGTIRATGGDVTARPNPQRLAELIEIYGRHKTDEDGKEIDLRPGVEDLAGVGMGKPVPIRPGIPVNTEAPMYDPETGELVTEFDLRPTPPRPVLPLPSGGVPSAGVRTVSYARRGPKAPAMQRVAGERSGFVELVMPANVFVMAAVFFAHVIGGILHIPLLFFSGFLKANTGVYIPAWLGNIFFWFAVAHYANVIQDVGPDTQDELPRPLRFAGLWDDILGPLLRAIIAFLLCYWPMLLAMQMPDRGRLIALPLMLLGAILFPAMLLTATAGGGVANFRPDRILRVMIFSGPVYMALAGLWFFILPLYCWTVLGVDLIGGILDRDITGHPVARKLGVILPAALLAVYLAHLFCWQLGMLYRQKHHRFGWAWQEHEKQVTLARQRRAEAKRARAAAARAEATRTA